MELSCPLCSSPSHTYYQNLLHHFLLCPECHGIFRDPKQYLSLKDEKSRYLHHRSDMKDEGYHQFILPIIKRVRASLSKGAKGLDFGCGHTPILSNYLTMEGYNMSLFDPIFFKKKSVLDHEYDFIVSCEVIEHFQNPLAEFKKLFQQLKKNGHLICKTHLLHSDIAFDNWYYKNDPTHVFIYQEATMNWIKDKFDLKAVNIAQRVIQFVK